MFRYLCFERMCGRVVCKPKFGVREMTLEFALDPALDWMTREVENNTDSLDVGDNAIWRVIDSPYRMRLFEMIRRSAGLTINELAQLTCTNPVNLYYHIRTLETHALIKPAGHREGVARRAPVIYVARISQILLKYNPNSKIEVERISHLRKSWIREAENSLSSPKSSDLTDDLSLFRWEKLSDEQYEEIRRHLQRVTMILDEARGNPETEASKSSLHYVGFQITDVPEDTLPAPRIRVQPEETIKDRAIRSDRELVKSKMQA